ncbi:MAG: hypothetical protein E5X14_21890, partial [Mesorhizobium sp.]
LQGAIVEVAPARAALMTAIAERIAGHGSAGLFIDYGHLEPGFGDTLQAVRRHDHEDVLANPGGADLTAHVDFAALAAAVREHGLQAELTTQSEFLLGMGLLERAGALTVCRSAGDVREAMANGSIAAVFHIEGVEAIDPELAMLDVLHAAGLRSLGIVWSRPNAFGNGVPFRFPSSPDTGPGLTDAGKALVKACNQLRIMIDLSHLNEKGFRDVAALSDAPLVATHSNVHAICGHSRNLTDWQLGAIRETGGMVGLNFATGFLREDGRMNADTSLDIMLRHIESLLQALGEDGVGLGSDFDGAMIPAVIGDVAGLPKLLDALAARGFGRALIEKIAYRNWLRVLERTIG